MRLRRLSIGLCLLITSSAALAQSRRVISPQAARQNDIRERICIADAERMRWEAAQMWGTPVIPNQNSEPNHHVVRVEQVNQPVVPKLRREWLTPSSESATPEMAGGMIPNVSTPVPMPLARTRTK
jgi:hypothetical protein